MTPPSPTLVAVATFNEMENLPLLVETVLQQLPHADVLVVDDNSPDGTGQWCDQAAADDSRIRCIHRPGKLGLGTALVATWRYALAHQYTYVLNMDADFSHHPRYLPKLIAAIEQRQVDVAVASRYVAGGGIEGWPLRRHVMSRAVNLYARTLLSLPVRDCSGSFRCYRTEMLGRLDFDVLRSTGFAVLEEVLWRLKRAGARMVEVPIQFADRRAGRSKIDAAEALAAVRAISTFGMQNWFCAGRKS